MRVDDVPLLLSPAFHAYGYGVGALLHAYLQAVRRTCELTRWVPTPHPGPRIECLWHEHLPAYLATCLPPEAGTRSVWLNHPAWYMRPVHVLLGWNGVHELRLGSSGHGGREALERVVADLRHGASTGVAVDGPHGPPREMKRGALEMALASGLPVVAYRFEYQRAWRAPGWDRKWCPRPGSRIEIHQSGPIFVTAATLGAARAAVTSALG